MDKDNRMVIPGTKTKKLKSFLAIFIAMLLALAVFAGTLQPVDAAVIMKKDCPSFCGCQGNWACPVYSFSSCTSQIPADSCPSGSECASGKCYCDDSNGDSQCDHALVLVKSCGSQCGCSGSYTRQLGQLSANSGMIMGSSECLVESFGICYSSQPSGSCPTGTGCNIGPSGSGCYCFDNDRDGYCGAVAGANKDCNDNDPAIKPGAAEICDGKDNNCDGKTDYLSTIGDLDLTSCGTDMQCKDYYCNEGVGCASTNMPSTTQCGTDTACTYTGCSGTCARTGTLNDYHCNGAGSCTYTTLACSGTCSAGTSCSAGSCASAMEICDGIDNDCDTEIDEGCECIDGQTRTISCGLTECANTADQTCVGGQWSGTCTPKPSSPEICDGLDNDCDGYTDNTPGSATDYTLTQSCYTGAPGTEGVGECNAGTQTCEQTSVCTSSTIECGGVPFECTTVCLAYGYTGQWGGCVGEANPQAETCNNLDDDCDGQTDEDLGSTTCGLGFCQVTMDNCISGVPQTCTPPSPPESSETSCSDTFDNDCDGYIDSQDPDCRCEISTALWSDTIVSDGTPVALMAFGKGYCEGESVTFDIWEDDNTLLMDWFGDLVNDDVVEDIGLTASFDSNNVASVQWPARYVTHDASYSPTEIGQPEYFFIAASANTVVPSSNLLIVTGNLPPQAPEPFLIEPNGGEVYDKSAVVKWEPASDPDDDALEYKLEYGISTESGDILWSSQPITQNYGYKKTAEYGGSEQEILVFDFG